MSSSRSLRKALISWFRLSANRLPRAFFKATNSPSDKPRWGSFGSPPLPGNNRRRTRFQGIEFIGRRGGQGGGQGFAIGGGKRAELIDGGVVNVVQHIDAAGADCGRGVTVAEFDGPQFFRPAFRPLPGQGNLIFAYGIVLRAAETGPCPGKCGGFSWAVNRLALDRPFCDFRGTGGGRLIESGYSGLQLCHRTRAGPKHQRHYAEHGQKAWKQQTEQ